MISHCYYNGGEVVHMQSLNSLVHEYVGGALHAHSPFSLTKVWQNAE